MVKTIKLAWHHFGSERLQEVCLFTFRSLRKVAFGTDWKSLRRSSDLNEVGDTSSEWVYFDEALHCYMKSNGYLGGLSFALGDEWCGADFDNVIVHEHTHPQVESWLCFLRGYRETSLIGSLGVLATSKVKMRYDKKLVGVPDSFISVSYT